MTLSYLKHELQRGDILVVSATHITRDCGSSEDGRCSAVAIVRGESLLVSEHLQVLPYNSSYPKDSEGVEHVSEPWRDFHDQEHAIAVWRDRFLRHGFWVFQEPGTPFRMMWEKEPIDRSVGWYRGEWSFTTDKKQINSALNALESLKGPDGDAEYGFFKSLELLA